MADIKVLAQSAKTKLDNGAAISEVDAISKAIKGAGIRGRADYKRLMSAVGTQYNRDRADERRQARRRA